MNKKDWDKKIIENEYCRDLPISLIELIICFCYQKNQKYLRLEELSELERIGMIITIK